MPAALHFAYSTVDLLLDIRRCGGVGGGFSNAGGGGGLDEASGCMASFMAKDPPQYIIMHEKIDMLLIFNTILVYFCDQVQVIISIFSISSHIINQILMFQSP